MFGSESNKNSVEEISLHLIDDVKENPRYREEDGEGVYNERYQEIKESIYRQKGAYLTLEVTPENGRYRIFKGGSTRLRIAQELFELERNNNTAPNPFERIQCMVYPHVDESVKLAMTATENLTRGSLCYGEKSRAMQYLKMSYTMKVPGDEVSVSEFLEYAELEGAKNLVPHRQEYYLLQGCYDYFLSANILCKKIIGGRANREFVRSASKIRSEFYSLCEAKGIDNADGIWRDMCASVDDEKLKIGALSKAVERYHESYKKSVLDRVSDDPQINIEEKLCADPVVNAELLIGEVVATGEYQGSRKKTNKLKAMGVDNDLAGFVKLLKMLPKKKQKTLLNQAINS